MRFLGRWISDSVVLAVSLLAAALFMQVPAVTHAYASALLQVAQQARRDIDQRESAARQYYHMTADTDDALLAALKPLEPANADALAQSIGRARDFQSEYDRISASPPLVQPVTAALGVLRDAAGTRRAVLATTLATYAPEIIMTLSGAIYALIGLIIGSLLAQVIVVPLRRDRRVAAY